ncbi:Cyclin N-terminal domain-containing protein [Heracleum sosnowskyi]|uniref:Cyclin N-terminal domain-containing protein n=1 Tax=Heracleum sosnowskyi TaxID=360622 RepID=A0AAD8JA62_9APIA|nr:Cyclin N-terminal domain-containing protein [Heracleum sosnowskyi]
MTILEQSHHQLQQGTSSFLLESLFCDEEFEAESLLKEEISDEDYMRNSRNERSPSLVLLENDLFWEDEELDSLLSKEKQAQFSVLHYGETNGSSSILVDRENAVNWMLNVKAHYKFSALTIVLAMFYFDKYVSTVRLQEDEPWMVQLAALTCLRLAAKVEETQVPRLLDIHVGDIEYEFEAKTIQNMELVVMSTLQWRMNPVTPFSFLDHITRRLGLKSNFHWEIFEKSETLLPSVVADRRSKTYLPSALATATMLQVIHQVDPSNVIEYQNILLAILRTTKEEINGCCELIRNISYSCYINGNNSHKRKYEEERKQKIKIPSSRCRVTDASFSTDNYISSSPESDKKTE